MTVRVIETRPDPDVVKRIVCRGCGSTLEYVPNDVKQYTDMDYGGGVDLVKYIDCPTCNKKVVVKRQ